MTTYKLTYVKQNGVIMTERISRTDDGSELSLAGAEELGYRLASRLHAKLSRVDEVA